MLPRRPWLTPFRCRNNAHASGIPRGRRSHIPTGIVDCIDRQLCRRFISCHTEFGRLYSLKTSNLESIDGYMLQMQYVTDVAEPCLQSRPIAFLRYQVASE